MYLQERLGYRMKNLLQRILGQGFDVGDRDDEFWGGWLVYACGLLGFEVSGLLNYRYCQGLTA